MGYTGKTTAYFEGTGRRAQENPIKLPQKRSGRGELFTFGGEGAGNAAQLEGRWQKEVAVAIFEGDICLLQFVSAASFKATI